MLEGYTADDAWMMVEDEFQTLAQSYTRHLHHAEYKRLMGEAKKAPRKSLPEPVSPMSKKTKQKLQRDTLASKQKEGLDEIILGKRKTDTTDAEEDKVEDPWRGTHLAGLMGPGSQEKRSLRGLERMHSSTKAAKGFSRYDNDDEQEAESSRSDVFGGLLRRKNNVTNGGDPHRVREEAQTGAISAVTSDERSGEDRRRRNHEKPVASGRRTIESSSPDGDPRSVEHEEPPRTTGGCPRVEPRRPFLKKKRPKEDEEASRKDRLAAVPMFLG